jgi:hypothetical protein
VTNVVIEHTDGRVLARVAGVTIIPRVGEFIEVIGDMLVVRSVLWALTDGPLVEARVLVESDS